MIRYETQVKARHWTFGGTFAGPSMSAVARECGRVNRRRTVRVRPDGSRDRWYLYRFASVPTL